MALTDKLKKTPLSAFFFSALTFSLLPVFTYLTQVHCEPCLQGHLCPPCPEGHRDFISLAYVLYNWGLDDVTRLDATIWAGPPGILFSAAIGYIMAHSGGAAKKRWPLLRPDKKRLILAGLGILSIGAIWTDFIEIPLFPFAIVTMALFSLNLNAVHFFAMTQRWPAGDFGGYLGSFEFQYMLHEPMHYRHDDAFWPVIILTAICWYLLASLIIRGWEKWRERI